MRLCARQSAICIESRVQPGEVYRHDDFYADTTSGELLSKYLLILAVNQAGDVVFRLLTSRQHGRPEQPPCFHGMPYPSFYLDVPGGPLNSKTWLDLRGSGDYDGDVFRQKMRNGSLHLVLRISAATLKQSLDCASRADDTTRAQATAIRDALAAIP